MRFLNSASPTTLEVTGDHSVAGLRDSLMHLSSTFLLYAVGVVVSYSGTRGFAEGFVFHWWGLACQEAHDKRRWMFKENGGLVAGLSHGANHQSPLSQ